MKVYRLITRNTYEREMFDKASLKLGLDKAVLQSMGSSKDMNLVSWLQLCLFISWFKLVFLIFYTNIFNETTSSFVPNHTSCPHSQQNQLSKKEIEDLLKRGAYGALMEDDRAGEEFCEEDIEQILQRRTQVGGAGCCELLI